MSGRETLAQRVAEFVRLVEAGASLAAMERFYAPDVVVYENRELARAGKDACLAYERAALDAQPVPAKIVERGRAVDDAEGLAFIEWSVRFTGADGRPMHLEEVARQRWDRGLVVEERFFYEGVVDEGDP